MTRAKFKRGDQVLVLSRKLEVGFVEAIYYEGFNDDLRYALTMESAPYSITVSQDDLKAIDEPEPLPLPPFSAHILSMLDIYVDIWKSDLEKLYKIQKLIRDPHELDSEIETLKTCIKNIENLVDDAKERCKYCALHRQFGHLDFCPEKDK